MNTDSVKEINAMDTTKVEEPDGMAQ